MTVPRLVAGMASLTCMATAAARLTQQGDASPPADARPQTVSRETRTLDCLDGPVEVSFDGLGVPHVRAGSFADALRAEGYLHARDRYGQMDLMRRTAAGELCELVGPLALSLDRSRRTLQLRAVATSCVADLPPSHRALLDAYVEGVNAGLASLSRPPLEHQLLQVAPTPWTAEDSMLVILSMWSLLNDAARSETSVALAAATMPQELRSYLMSPFTTHDAPVMADAIAWGCPPIPGPDVIDTRRPREIGVEAPETTPGGGDATPPSDPPASPSASDLGPDGMETALARLESRQSECRPGSNAWLVAGKHTEHGSAILASDMHLPITAPAIWYRISIEYADGEDSGIDGARHETSPTAGRGESAMRTAAASASGSNDVVGRCDRRLDGISLAGVPGIVSGSNGVVAWGFTNVDADFIDFVIVEPDAADPSRYLVPGGTEQFEVVTESLRVRSQRPQQLEIRKTRWGPIVGRDHSGKPIAMRWSALDRASVNLALLDLGRTESVRAALDVAEGWKGPQQNLMVADHDGSIGWSIIGPLPRRQGFDGSTPTSWADGTRSWVGLFEGASRPRVEDPPEGFIVTANQRTVPIDVARSMSADWGSPDRAARICERLRSSGSHDEATCAELQLDTRVERLVRWRDALLEYFDRDRSPGAADIQAHDAQARDSDVPETSESVSTPRVGVAAPAQAPRPDASRAVRDANAANDAGPFGQPPTGRVAALLDVLRSWSGHADANEEAVALVDGFRRRFVRALLEGIASATLSGRPDGSDMLNESDRRTRLDIFVRLPVNDENVRQILMQRPAHLLPRSSEADGEHGEIGNGRQWHALVERLLLESAANVSHDDALIRWGKWNVSDFGHPLLRAVPALASQFMLPTHEQPGHPSAVRVATPSFSASDRLVVSPGHEERALVQMPGGQSGDPRSVHFANHHPYWRDGDGLPLRPGRPVSTVLLTPARAEDGPPAKGPPPSPEEAPAASTDPNRDR